MSDLQADPTTCDHPFDQLELYNARETRAMSCTPTLAVYDAVIYCKKCNSYVLLTSDYSDWDQPLYHDLIMGGRKPVPKIKRRWYAGNKDLTNEQLKLLDDLREMVNHKHAKEMFEKLWNDEPKLMAQALAKVTEALSLKTERS